MKKYMFIILVAAAGMTAVQAQATDTTGNGNSSLGSTATQPSTQPANDSSGTVATNGYGRQHYILRNGADTNQASEFNSTSNTIYAPASSSANNTKANDHHHWWQFWK